VVRLEEAKRPLVSARRCGASGCTSPAGGSPVPVGAGAPGSRPQARGEIPVARAGRRKPLRREQEHGPQRYVNPAASTEEQWRSRAAHVTAKAMSDAHESGVERASGPPGVRGAARVHGGVRNERGPSARPPSRQGVSYKPMVKSSPAQRESEGVVVLWIATTNNVAGGKDPCFGRARTEGSCEGMAGRTGPNSPSEHKLGEEARRCRSELRRGAKRDGLWVGAPACSARSDAPADGSSMQVRRVHAPSRGPSVSRVREIRTHGLNGGLAVTRFGGVR
jgi:hypothetical protein